MTAGSSSGSRSIAFDLKAFHEKSNLVFIVVGVWLESNRLVLYNGDLAGRLIPVDADRWDLEDLRKVIDSGEPLLSVHFSEAVKAEILEQSQLNVGVIQETCYRLCEGENIFNTQSVPKSVGSVESVRRVVKSIAAEQAGRYQKFLEDFVQGFSATELEMYRWIAYTIVTSTPRELKNGLKLATIFKKLNEVHPKRKGVLQQNNVGQALANVGRVQQKYRVQPIILDFETNENTLRIADSGFILFIASRERKELLELVGIRTSDLQPDTFNS